MPAVTITRIRSFVAGNRKRIVAFVNIAADADFLDVGNIMHRIEGISAVSETNQAIGATTSPGSDRPSHVPDRWGR